MEFPLEYDMTLVNRQHSLALFSSPAISNPRLSRTRASASSSSSSSSSSSAFSNYSFGRARHESATTSEGCCSPKTPTPSSVDCSSRCTHIRRKSNKPKVIRPLPPIPSAQIRPLPQPIRVRKLPSLPPSPRPEQTSKPPLPLKIVTGVPERSKKCQPLAYDPYFRPEIDWDKIMIEIVRGGSESDADSIYTDATAD